MGRTWKSSRTLAASGPRASLHQCDSRIRSCLATEAPTYRSNRCGLYLWCSRSPSRGCCVDCGAIRPCFNAICFAWPSFLQSRIRERPLQSFGRTGGLVHDLGGTKQGTGVYFPSACDSGGLAYRRKVKTRDFGVGIILCRCCSAVCVSLECDWRNRRICGCGR